MCFHKCVLSEGQTGFCKARKNIDGKIISLNYGRLTSLCLDPIEKKPFKHFYQGSMVLSVGSFGCNFRCPFCQNHEISMAGENDIETIFMAPENLSLKAAGLKSAGNIGVAYTYNEPLVGFEYVMDCSRQVKLRGMKNIIISNGSISKEKWVELMCLTDAVNIDLKGFSMDWYKELKGDLSVVKKNVEIAMDYCHVEITTLIVPGKNDSEMEMRNLSQWLSEMNKNIPLHISRFFPKYKMENYKPTDVASIYNLAEIAGKYLNNVYTGNC